MRETGRNVSKRQGEPYPIARAAGALGGCVVSTRKPDGKAEHPHTLTDEANDAATACNYVVGEDVTINKRTNDNDQTERISISFRCRQTERLGVLYMGVWALTFRPCTFCVTTKQPNEMNRYELHNQNCRLFMPRKQRRTKQTSRLDSDIKCLYGNGLLFDYSRFNVYGVRPARR